MPLPEGDLLGVSGERLGQDGAGEQAVEIASGGRHAQVVADQLRAPVDQVSARGPERRPRTLGGQDQLGIGIGQRGEVPRCQTDLADAPGAEPRRPMDLRNRSPGAGSRTSRKHQCSVGIACGEVPTGDAPSRQIDLDLVDQRRDLRAAQLALGFGEPAVGCQLCDGVAPVFDQGVRHG